MANKMMYSFENGGLTFGADGFTPCFFEDGDFWRMHLDFNKPGLPNDLGVYSHMQKQSKFTSSDGKTVIEYNGVTAEDGNTYDIKLTLTVAKTEDGLKFSYTAENNSEVRVNEVQYPFFEFARLNGELEDDVLYYPYTVGKRIKNPHAFTASRHTEYMAADYKNIWNVLGYPMGNLSMPWYGVESGGKFVYLASHDEKCRFVQFLTGAEPREAKTRRFIMAVATYPAANSGEAVEYGDYILAVADGDWRGGADIYKAWAKNSWLETFPKKETVRKLDGWQRIILKHQHGEIYHTYDELPRIYREGAKYGLTMILLFAWWQEGMDNGYPNYQPDEALGGAEKLRAAIHEINEMGGTVVLYANGHIIDVSTDYYKNEGYKYTMKDIEKNEYREFYKFSNNGTLLRTGHKTFATGCYGTKEWKDKLTEISERHFALGSNGTFFDQISVAFQTCFDSSHSHGNRVDEDLRLRSEWVRKRRSELTDDQLFGTEWLNDRITPYMDFIHGCGEGHFYTKGAYPYMFKYVFPEAQYSNRLIHDERSDFKKQLNYAFIFGMMFDVSIYRGRAKSIEVVPEYAAYVKKLIDMRAKYRTYFTDGSFDIYDSSLPEGLWTAKYTYGGKSIVTVWNDTGADAVIEGVTVKNGEATVVEVNQ